MNTSYNHADFIGMCLESDEDHEPYGYNLDTLETMQDTSDKQVDKSIECILFAPGSGYLFHDY